MGTVCLQVWFVGYLWLAPWEELNLDVEAWLENSAVSAEVRAVEPGEMETPLMPAGEEASGSERRPRSLADAVRHTVRKGENLSEIWARYAGNLDRFHEARAALQSAGLKFSSFRVGEMLELSVREGGDIRRMRKKMADGRVAVLKADENDSYIAYFTAPKIKEQKKTVTATINDSFVRAARDASVPYEVIDEFVDLFGARVDFSKDLQPGDTFSVVYDEQTVRGNSRPLRVEIQAASIKLSEKLFAVVKYSGRDGKARYYDEKGRLLGNYFLRYPVQFTRISSVFTKSRLHPVLGRYRPHPGVDLAAPIGTPVRSVADGVVTSASFRGGAGNMIEIRHGNSVRTIYMHLSRFASGVRSGSRVERGQVIGKVGSTGLSTGPHLDYRLAVGGKFVNPLTAELPQLLNAGDNIPAKLLQATLKTLIARHENMNIAFEVLSAPKSSV